MRKIILIIVFFVIYLLLEIVRQESISFLNFFLAKLIDVLYAVIFFITVDSILEAKRKNRFNRHLLFAFSFLLFVCIFWLFKFLLFTILAGEIASYLSTTYYFSIFFLLCLYFLFSFYQL